MFKRLLVIPIISVFVLAFYYSGVVFAADEGTVTATVTVQNISLTVTNGTVTYGILALSSTNNTSTLGQTQTVTNTGNVPIKVNIKGKSATPSWTLASTIGANQYVHQFCLATCGTYPTNYTPMTTSYSQIVASLAASGTQSLDLGISTPSSSTDYTQQSVDVMVQAAAV